MPQVVYQGAEAIITKDGTILTKERVRKGYRIEQLDTSIRKKRTRLEAKLLNEARRAGVLTPHIIEQGNFTIKMDFIHGKKVKDAVKTKNCTAIGELIGKNVATLHNYNIIHGDLTTSNMILKSKGTHAHVQARESQKTRKSGSFSDTFDIYFIDFGIGFFSTRIEDKATDIHLLKQAVESTHYDLMEKIWPAVVKSYKKQCKDGEAVMKTLSKIEKRGRYSERSQK